MKIYKSDRDIALFCTKEELNKPIISMENYCKWYAAYIIYPSGAIIKLDFEELEEGFEIQLESAYYDHTPNPIAICSYASAHKFDICSYSLAAITRRWFNEYWTTKYEIKHSYNRNET